MIPLAAGDKAKARDLLAAIRTLKAIEHEKRSATQEEKQTLARFPGFGSIALSIFPDPVTGQYKDGWQAIAEELKSLLTPGEYASAKRTTFNAFYTSPTVMLAMHQALARLGVPAEATVLEPGCGTGNFMSTAPHGMRFIGVELDSISGRIARAIYPEHDIRIEGFQDTELPQVDAVIGNPPFANVKIPYQGKRLSLHDFFIRKSLDALKPGGVLAVVTSRFTLDRQNAAVREAIAETSDFLGAIRLPSDAFKREGASVVTDIVFLRKRAPGAPANHADPAWLDSKPLEIEGKSILINAYFHHHPQMVLGTWSGKDTPYGGEGYSVVSNGNLAEHLREAIQKLPNLMGADSAPLEPADQQRKFTPAPLEPHIGEGSFFIGDDRAIRQIVNGQAEPVVYGGATLNANATMTGKRLAGLIGLRDRARRVLQSQNDGWPAKARDDARRELNWAYDRFSATYGPINKTTVSFTKGQTAVRRMPNLVKFREDPDAMLVMSLEEYDEATGAATKAPIMKQDVVGKHPPVTKVNSAEEGLLVSLDQSGVVDLPFIAELYGKPEPEIISELGDLIYFDPESKQWQTADEYLSGDVRRKLRVADRAPNQRNVDALRAVQPEDVLPGDIDANVGAPWIPASDIQAFACELFKVGESSVKIEHLPKEAAWSVEAGYEARVSVAATSDYGTGRAGGTWLLDLALNMKSPTIYDTIHVGGKEERVVNPEETLAAKEKQRLIKERFRSWIFADPVRAERLVRLYNDTYNNLRPRLFDGSHLDFAGMNQAIQLRPHQKDAVWRIMSGGNTLLAHCVGAGKTFTMAAAGMKMKQAGLIKKPLYVVPNHLLEQFAREFQQLYPNARLLLATKEDFTKDRRKLLTAKIASGDWDGIIITHSSFERIGMSREYQEKFLRELIAEYGALLCQSAMEGNRNIIKTLEKQKVAREERLKDLLAEDKKDDGLVFNELGIDHVFIDEAQYFKNLETPTKMDRVAGIQTAGSERAFDLYLKCRYLHELHPGHGITFATGTPISNTMVEMYTMQRYLDPEGLKACGIDHFDAWAATFGEVVESMEIAPDGKSLRPRSRFAKFVNLPELQQMFRSFADVQTAEMLKLPRPSLEGGKPHVVATPMSEEQSAIQKKLVERYERLRSQKVDPREDNALNITTDGRKLALDARMLFAGARDCPGSKLNALADNVADIWQRTASKRGAQMIFCDMGVNPGPSGFSAYDEIIRKLIERGIPREQVATVGDADSDAKKQALFEKVRQGTIRVLLGSTLKMGTGTNVQKRLVALHHVDAPWKPAEVEQREGRILRQGNENEQVAIYRYVTEGSFDSYMWQALETKAKFINQIMTGENAARRAEDVANEALSYAEVKAIASGNPAVLTLAEADAELKRLSILERSHADEQYIARKKLKELPETIERLKTRLTDLSADAETVQAHAADPITIGSRKPLRDELLPALKRTLESLPQRVLEQTRYPLGVYKGLRFGVVLHPHFAQEVFLQGKTSRLDTLSRDSHGPRAVLNALERLAGSYGVQCDSVRRDLGVAESQLSDYHSRIGAVFRHDGYLSKLTALRDELKMALSKTKPTNESVSSAAATAKQIKALIAGNTLGDSVTRVVKKVAETTMPVTARIRIERESPRMGPGGFAAGRS